MMWSGSIVTAYESGSTRIPRSIKGLVKAFWRDIARDPPDDLADQLGRAKPTTEEAKVYFKHMLMAAFPTADEVADGMKITTVVKDVTWATLKYPEFVEWLNRVFPMRK